MKARLGFAISVHINPDIMIIDEALSIGDSTFTQKCLDKMNSFRKEGKTLIFVSHGMGQIWDFCNKTMWLEYGTQRAFGLTEEVVPMYERFVKTYNAMSVEQQREYKRRIDILSAANAESEHEPIRRNLNQRIEEVPCIAQIRILVEHPVVISGNPVHPFAVRHNFLNHAPDVVPHAAEPGFFLAVALFDRRNGEPVKPPLFRSKGCLPSIRAAAHKYLYGINARIRRPIHITIVSLIGFLSITSLSFIT